MVGLGAEISILPRWRVFHIARGERRVAGRIIKSSDALVRCVGTVSAYRVGTAQKQARRAAPADLHK
jgi:hypothetical protein